MGLPGITDSLIAAIIYAAGQKIWNGFSDPLKKALAETEIYFSKNKGIEISYERLKAVIDGEVGKNEIYHFKSGDNFIQGDELALQLAIFGDLYIVDESKILEISREIMSYFKAAFERQLLINPKTSAITLANFQQIIHKITQTEHKKILDELRHVKFTVDELKEDSERRYEREIIQQKYADFKIINEAFWNEVRDETDREHLFYYYIKTDSSPIKLREVVANDYYIPNEKIENEFNHILKQAVADHTALIKILSKGGEGKSTFLHHIAKTYFEGFNIIMLEDFEDEICVCLEERSHELNLNHPVIFLLDNPVVYGGQLIRTTQKLIEGFRKYRLVFVVTEREIRYRHIEDINTFESYFNNTYTIEYRAQHLRKRIFEKLFSAFEITYRLSEEIKSTAQDIYLEDWRRSISENTFAVLKYLRSKDKIKFSFDWEDWEKFANERAPTLERLYLILATFYQFGFSLDIDFCTTFLQNADSIDIISALDENKNLPIFRRGHHIFLRHEMVGSWYLDDSDDDTRKNRINSEYIFKQFLDHIDTPFAKDLFIWICKNEDFKRSYLSKYINDEKNIDLLISYIQKNRDELKCRTELSKIYQKIKKWDEAEKILLDSLRIEPNQVHARTELSTIYRRQKKLDNAVNILLESLKIDPLSLHTRTLLGVIYQRQKKWDKAELILLESLKIDPKNSHALRELCKLYQTQKNWEKAEYVFVELLKSDPDNLYVLEKLDIIYQGQENWDKLERTQIKSLSLCIDSEELHSHSMIIRTRLSRTYQIQNIWDKAENILLESLKIDPTALHPRIELSKIYQRQNRWDEAENVLLESLKIDPDDLYPQDINPRIELCKIYQSQEEWQRAENILIESLNINPGDLQTRREISKIYQRINEWDKAEKILIESLEFDSEDLYHKDINPRIELSKIYQRQKKWQQAEKILIESIKLNHIDQHSRVELSKIYRIQKEWNKAEMNLLELLNFIPDDISSLTMLSKIYQSQKKWEEAEKALLECLDIRHDNIISRTELSKIYQRQEKWDEAEKILKSCLEVDPNDLHSRTELGKIYQLQERWEEAESLLHECLEINVNDINALLELGKLSTKFGDRYSDAETYFKKILALEPDNLHAKTELSILYYKMGKYYNRESLLFEIYEDHPKDILNLANLARMFKRFRKYRIALKLLEKALEIDNQDLLTIYELLRLYEVLNFKEKVIFFKKEGERIISKFPHSKNTDRILNHHINIDQEITLLELMKVGYWVEDCGNVLVGLAGENFPLIENACVNSQVKHMHKVYYVTYSKDGKIFANFVEPFFENIDNLWELK